MVSYFLALLLLDPSRNSTTAEPPNHLIENNPKIAELTKMFEDKNLRYRKNKNLHGEFKIKI